MASRYFSLREADQATGTTVVVDVLRAFTTAAYAFDRGARRIVMVSTIDQAKALREMHQNWLLMGELGGWKIDGFDFSNSPVEISEADLADRTLVQRTTAGTQGVVGACNATKLFCASMVCASATARAIENDVDFVITGRNQYETATGGDEDLACAEMIDALRYGSTESTAYVDRVRSSRAAKKLLQSRELAHPLDVQYACDIDRFDFVMQVERDAELLSVTAATV